MRAVNGVVIWIHRYSRSGRCNNNAYGRGGIHLRIDITGLRIDQTCRVVTGIKNRIAVKRKPVSKGNYPRATGVVVRLHSVLISQYTRILTHEYGLTGNATNINRQGGVSSTNGHIFVQVDSHADHITFGIVTAGNGNAGHFRHIGIFADGISHSGGGVSGKIHQRQAHCQRAVIQACHINTGELLSGWTDR